MKKTLIALAAVAVSSAAMAQVTVSGGYGVAYQSFDSAAGKATASTAESGTVADGNFKPATLGTAATAAATNKGFAMTDSSVRFTATEDLGGGMRASGFVQFSANDLRGGNITKEDSNLSLSGGFGSITIANTRSSNAAIAANVFASAMPVTSIYASTDSRAAIDMATYTTPELVKGLRLSVSQIETTQSTGTSAGKVNVIGASYSAGPLAITLAQKDYNSTLNAAGAEDRTEGALVYDLGVAKVGLGYGTKTTATGDAVMTYGVSVPMGAITIGVNGATRGDANFYDAGVAYALSKRTTINAMTGSRNTGAKGAADLSQYRVGIFHSF